MPSSQSVILRAKGLYTHGNPLSAVPEGSLQIADNVVIDRNEVIEPRRGFKQYGNTFGGITDRTKQLFVYKDRILRHILTNIQYDSNAAGSFINFSGNSVEEIESNLRIKSIEANGNLYFTSKSGIQKISANNSSDFSSISIQDSGGVKSLDLETTLNFSSNGFLTANSQVGYKLVWGINDHNDNLILGVPSVRSVVYNFTESQACTVDIRFNIPSLITTTDYFYQIYRTPIYSAPYGQTPIDPGQEFYLVYEQNVTNTDISNGYILTTDITPDSFRENGALLYTNAVSGEGALQANERPPFAKDITLYKGYTFVSNTQSVQRLNLSFLSIQGMVSNVSNITISDGTNTTTYTFQGAYETYTLDYGTSVLGDFTNGVAGPAKYFVISSSSDERKYYVWYYKTVNDEDPQVSGAMGVKIDITGSANLDDVINATINGINLFTTDFNTSKLLSVLTIECSNNGLVTNAVSETILNGQFSITKDNLGLGEDIPNQKILLPKIPSLNENGPTTSQQLDQVARSFNKVVNANDPIVFAYYLSDVNDIPGKVLLESQLAIGDAFFLTSNVGSQFSPTLPTSGNSVISTNEVRPNRLYYSKYQQPEAFPLVNYLDIGPKDREIKRIIALRDSLFVLKEDGIYRLSGESAPFTVAPFDSSSQILAPDSACVLNNQIYALSTQGVIVITDTGVSVISRPIENQLLKITRETYNYKQLSFGVSYETDRSYLLWTVSNTSDTSATQCFRYNTFTNSWTRWPINKTCGIVNFSDDKLYLGAGDMNFIEQERKTLTRADHADREDLREIILNGVMDNIITINSLDNIEIGDVLIQTQYLSINQFNRLLLKLDNDKFVDDNDYISLIATNGINLRENIVNLATKLDNDSAIIASNFSSKIGNYTYNITSTASGTQTIITIGSHNLEIGRFITIVNCDASPSINGTWEIINISPTTITIDTPTTSNGTTGALQTNVDNFQDIQTCFNIIIYILNNDAGVFYNNYDYSQNTIEFESSIVDINNVQHDITLLSSLPLLNGPFTLYKAINTQIVWNPQFFGDPTIEKQVRESTLLVENTNFSTATLSYASDRSPSFVDNVFHGMGNGDWGQFNWGGINWGGVGAPTPLRTYVPLEKQRCRFINMKFSHKVAFEKYNIFGMSLTFRPYNIRTTR